MDPRQQQQQQHGVGYAQQQHAPPQPAARSPLQQQQQRVPAAGGHAPPPHMGQPYRQPVPQSQPQLSPNNSDTTQQRGPSPAPSPAAAAALAPAPAPARVDQLADNLNRVDLHAQGPPSAATGGPQPARAKRSARAYHQPDQAPPASQLQQQQQQPSYGDASSHPGQHHPSQPHDPRFLHHQQQQQPQGPTAAGYGQAPPAPAQYQQHNGAGAAPQQQQQHHHPDPHQQQSQPHQQQQRPLPAYLGPVEPERGIPQPPHSAGQRIPGKMRVRIDPDHIPSPVAVQEVDQQLYRDEPYMTCSRMAAPLATTEFLAIDQGNANPRFMRMTTYNLPHSDDLAHASQLPLGLVVQPFAQLREEEGQVPVVDFQQDGPPRCQRCRGYINPWCLFVEGGQKFICNLCSATSDVPPFYFSHLDMSQRRMDLDERPELRFGSVDFLVGKDYWVQDSPATAAARSSGGGALSAMSALAASTTSSSSSAPNRPSPREPVPLNYIFAIDVSWTSARCGLVKEVVNGLRELLYPKAKANGDANSAANGAGEGEGEDLPCGLPAGSKIGILTFDKTVQFFNLKAGLDQAQMLVVPDIDDMFLPVCEGFLVDPIESRSVIEGLFETLPNLSSETAVADAAIGGPVRAAMLALKGLGGQVNIFQTTLPTSGPGPLKHREDSKLYGTDKEKTLFTPQDPFYRVTAEECVEQGIGINLFLFPTQYIDVATLGVLSGVTGGELFFHPRFEPVRDGATLRSEIKRVVQRETGYSVTMRIRCSNGLRVADHYGNFFQRNVTDLEFGTVDADKAVAAKLKHEGKLDDKVDAHFQCAVLYTSAYGERRVRVHNLAVPVTTLLANVFRFACMDTTIAFVSKEAITHAGNNKSLRQVRDSLTDTCVKSLLAYRKHCASSTSPAQLILPESFKLFPLYALALMKSKALKGGPVASDVRTWHMRLIKSAGVAATVGLLYPRMLPIHMLAEDVGFPDERGRLRLPPLIRTSYARMEPHGAYLIENGEIAILWIGQAVSPQILQDLYAVENLDQLDTRMSTLPELPTLLSTQLRNILSLFERQRGDRRLPVLIARQNIDGTEIEFSNMLVEDSNNEQLSYVDSLCHIHSLLQSELMGESKKDHDISSTSFTTW